MRLNRPRQKNGTLHPQILHPVLHHRQLQSNHAGNLNRTTERNLPVALREMQIADAELGSLDMDWQIRLAPPAQVFDIAVPAMLGPARDGPSAFFPDLRLDIVRSASGMDVLRFRRLGDDKARVGIGTDELAFTAVPFGEDLG